MKMWYKVQIIGLHSLYEIIDESIREDASNSISDGKIIKLDYHPKVSQLHDLLDNGRSKIEQIRDKYRKETGIDSLKITNNNVIGLFIEITSILALSDWPLVIGKEVAKIQRPRVWMPNLLRTKKVMSKLALKMGHPNNGQHLNSHNQCSFKRFFKNEIVKLF